MLVTLEKLTSALRMPALSRYGDYVAGAGSAVDGRVAKVHRPRQAAYGRGAR
jgi:hypothetical protein